MHIYCGGVFYTKLDCMLYILGQKQVKKQRNRGISFMLSIAQLNVYVLRYVHKIATVVFAVSEVGN